MPAGKFGTAIVPTSRSVEPTEYACTTSCPPPDAQARRPSGDTPNWRPAGVTVQPAAVTGPLVPAPSAAVGATAARRSTRTRRRLMKGETVASRYRPRPMATASAPAAAPSATTRVPLVQRLLPAAATVVGVAVLLGLVYDQYLNYAARYGLLWARDLARGLKRDYEAEFAPTPHP